MKKSILLSAILLASSFGCRHDSSDKPVYVATDSVAEFNGEVSTNPADNQIKITRTWPESKLTFCQSDKMNTGKNLSAFIEERSDGLRRYYVRLTLDGAFYQDFETLQQPVEDNGSAGFMVSIDATIIAAYGLPSDTVYLISYDPKALTFKLSGSSKGQILDTLGVPPATCSVVAFAN